MSSEAEIRSLSYYRRRGMALLLVAALLGLIGISGSGPASAAPGDISTYAGNGGIGCSGGDGGPATSAQFSSGGPTGLAFDSAGNAYVTDYYCNNVRRIDAVTGIITTVAGSGAPGVSGDGGPATSAAVGAPNDVVLDSAGNLYIAQIENHVIRRVDAATGVITTVAGIGVAGFSGDGGPATSAQLREPSALGIDSAGNLYIADAGNNRVRRVDAVTGVITTVAGTGARGFNGDNLPATNSALNFPYDVSVDPAGNLYILDNGNCRIRRVDATTGFITTVVGGAGCGSAGDGGPGTAAQVSSGAYYLTTDAAGNVFWSEVGGRVRMLNVTTGIVTTVAGTGVRGFSGDGGPATLAQLNEPYAVAVNGAGDLFIADAANERVRRVEAVGAPITTTTTSSSTTTSTSTSTTSTSTSTTSTSTSTTSTTLAPTTTTTTPPGGVPTNKDQCKNGGWQTFGFRNQGQCVSFVNGRR